MISIYQGGAIMIMSLLLFENEFLNIVSISFTELVLNELIMVAVQITTWYAYLLLSIAKLNIVQACVHGPLGNYHFDDLCNLYCVFTRVLR